MSTFGTTLDGSKMQDIYTSQVYNVNTNHPIIPNSQEYSIYKQYVSIIITNISLNIFKNIL